MGASRPRIGVSTQNPGLKLIVVVVNEEGTTEKETKKMRFDVQKGERFDLLA